MDFDKPFYKILDEICKEQNIQQTILSYGWIRQLQKDNQVHHIIRYQFDLNTANAYHIANDKFATYELLKNHKVPAVEHKPIFNVRTRKDYFTNQMLEEVEKFLQKDGKFVVKANESCRGQDVFLCTSFEEFKEISQKLFLQNDIICICPYIPIAYEYRAIYLDGEIIYIYKKRKPYVVGDGKSTLQELIEQKNHEQEVETDYMKNLDLQYIPKNKEEVTISWKHNLSSGAKPVLVTEKEENLQKIKEIALDAGKAIGIRFASIDVAVTDQKEIAVLEINASVCMNHFAEYFPNGYTIAKEIYTKAIQKMFSI